MADIEKTKNDPVDQLWEILDASHGVMLGSPVHEQHMQPMAPQPARDEKAIWFFTRKSSELAKSAANGGMVHMCLISKEHDYHACLHGELEVKHSPAHIKRFWSSMVSAWFPGGKEDPDLTLLRFTPKSAGIWASTDSALKFGWEIAKANITGGEPDMGYSTEVRF